MSKGSLANLEDEALEAEEQGEGEEEEQGRTTSPFKRPESMASQASSTTRRIVQEQEEQEKDPFSLRDTDSRKLATEAVCFSLSRRIRSLRRD